jgi:PhoH-like ATPase
MKKTYVLDTNVLLSDPDSIHSFEDNDLLLPILVLEELDKHKTRSDDVGRNARQVSRNLDAMREHGNFHVGVNTRGGGLLRIVPSVGDPLALLPKELQKGSSLDNMIIGFMLEHKAQDIVLVSKDINIRVKCDSLGLKCQDYLKMRVSSDVEDLYRGVKVLHVSETLVDEFYKEGSVSLQEATQENVFPNQVVILKTINAEGNTIKSAMSRCHPGGSLKSLPKLDDVFGLRPRNKEQTFSLDLLLDDNIKLLSLTGKAGCGKTLLAIAAGLEQLISMGSLPKYQKLIVSRPVQPVGKDIGYLPGTLEEKMEPWIAPIRDNLDFLLGANGKKHQGGRKKKSDEHSISSDPYLELMQQKGLIEIEAISFIRGRSIPNAFIIIDEAQNLTIHELKTIVTRVGEGTKIVLTGDIEQIDNVDVDIYTNGLTYAIEKFKEYDISGHVTLLKGERSALATLASKIL